MNILFLGGNQSQSLADWLVQQGENVTYAEEPINLATIQDCRPEFIVSYNYRHILKQDIFNALEGRAVNLHISYLSYNRGANPTIWSFLENTPKGVTIHYIDGGIDTGDIIAQKEVYLDFEKETLRSAHHILHNEIQTLFKNKWQQIKTHQVERRPQGPENRGGTLERTGPCSKLSSVKKDGTPQTKGSGTSTALCLRRVTLNDKDMIHRWRNLPEVRKYMYTDHEITHEEHSQWFGRMLDDQTCRYWTICCDGEDVGVANLYDISHENKRCYWAFYIAGQNMRGKGVGSFVEYAVLSHVFDKMKFNKLCCEVLTFNESVIFMHKRFGFKQEGIFRQHVMKERRPMDIACLAMLKNDWVAQKPQIKTRLEQKGLI